VSNAAILLKLLKQVDAERLEVFLEPHVMLHLLQETGIGDEALHARIAAGEKPGTLLLSLLQEHTADELWAMIPDELREHSLSVVRERQAEQLEKGPQVRTAPLLVGLVGAILPTMYALGTFPEWGSGVTLGGVVFAIVLSGAAGAWSLPSDRFTGAVACAVGSVVSVVAGSLLAPHLGDFPRLGVLAALAPAMLVTALLWLGLTWYRKREPQAF
jgi:hypothetical protein